jgi:hypothetical protein
MSRDRPVRARQTPAHLIFSLGYEQVAQPAVNTPKKIKKSEPKPRDAAPASIKGNITVCPFCFANVPKRALRTHLADHRTDIYSEDLFHEQGVGWLFAIV